jgi:SP family facilitated glucose transporter-like MFS transporter 3
MAPASAPTASQDSANLQIDIQVANNEDSAVPFAMVSSTRHGVTPTPPSGPDADPGFTRPLVFAWIIAILGSGQFGYGVGVTGAVQSAAVFPGHAKLAWSTMVSVFSLGGLLGAFASGRLLTTWPRKRVMLVGAVLYVISGVVMGGAANMAMLSVGRFLTGIAGGSSTVAVPLYLKEIAPSRLRGTLGTGHQIAAVAGVLVADVLAFGFAGRSVSVTNPGWRFLLGFTTLTGIVQILLMPFVAESPVWLASASRLDDAAAVLRSLRGPAIRPPQLASELKIIELAIADRKDGSSVSFRTVLADRTIRRQLVVGALLHMLMRFSGFNAVTFYANQILEQSGIDKPLIGTALVGTVNTLATVIALVLIDRSGRRPLLLWSSIGMFVSSVVLTLTLNNLLPAHNTLSIGSVMGFVAFFEIGLGPIPWTLVPEIMPAKPRATAVSLATSVNWISLFIVGLVFPTMQSSLKNFTFVPFAVCQILALLLVFWCVPETKGKSVEEIADAMNDMKRK